MMKLRILASAALSCVCACASVTATAAPEVPLKGLPFYWGVGYSWVDYTETGAMGEASVGALVGRFGYHIFEMLDAEVRYGQGLRGGDVGGIPIELDQMYGVYAKFNLRTDIDFTPYLIAGYTQGEMTNGIISNSDHDYSYGAGVDFCSDQPVCMYGEYMSYLAKDTFESSGITLGLRVDF